MHFIPIVDTAQAVHRCLLHGFSPLPSVLSRELRLVLEKVSQGNLPRYAQSPSLLLLISSSAFPPCSSSPISSSKCRTHQWEPPRIRHRPSAREPTSMPRTCQTSCPEGAWRRGMTRTFGIRSTSPGRPQGRDPHLRPPSPPTVPSPRPLREGRVTAVLLWRRRHFNPCTTPDLAQQIRT